MAKLTQHDSMAICWALDLLEFLDGDGWSIDWNDGGTCEVLGVESNEHEKVLKVTWPSGQPSFEELRREIAAVFSQTGGE